jgi:uncharacterized membrane protein YfcA
MLFSFESYVAVSLVLFASSIVQGAVGFAAGLFGIPLLMLCGVSMPDAVAMSLVAAAPQNIIPAWQLRREIDFRGALRPALIRFAFLPLGIYALSLVGQERKDLASQLIGGIVLVIVAVQWLWQTHPQPKLHIAWEWLAFSLGGFLLGFCGMGGPPMVLWVLAHDWSMIRARAFLFFIFAIGIPIQAFLMWLRFGGEVVDAMLLSASALPAVLIGLWLGLQLSRLFPDRALRRMSVAVLVLIALSAIVAPYSSRRKKVTNPDAFSQTTRRSDRIWDRRKSRLSFAR